jgi:hypothetical protein
MAHRNADGNGVPKIASPKSSISNGPKSCCPASRTCRVGLKPAVMLCLLTGGAPLMNKPLILVDREAISIAM